MTKKSAPTQRQRAERARRQAMGIALIQKPLKYIRSKSDYFEEDVKGNKRRVEGLESRNARYAANAGNGALVQRIARSI